MDKKSIVLYGIIFFFSCSLFSMNSKQFNLRKNNLTIEKDKELCDWLNLEKPPIFALPINSPEKAIVPQKRKFQPDEYIYYAYQRPSEFNKKIGFEHVENCTFKCSWNYLGNKCIKSFKSLEAFQKHGLDHWERLKEVKKKVKISNCPFCGNVSPNSYNNQWREI